MNKNCEMVKLFLSARHGAGGRRRIAKGSVQRAATEFCKHGHGTARDAVATAQRHQFGRRIDDPSHIRMRPSRPRPASQACRCSARFFSSYFFFWAWMVFGLYMMARCNVVSSTGALMIGAAYIANLFVSKPHKGSGWPFHWFCTKCRRPIWSSATTERRASARVQHRTPMASTSSRWRLTASLACAAPSREDAGCGARSILDRGEMGLLWRRLLYSGGARVLAMLRMPRRVKAGAD